MAAVFDLIPAFTGFRSGLPSRCSSLSSCTSSISVIRWPENGRNGSRRWSSGRKLSGGGCRAMVQQTLYGSSVNYAKEMERLSAKESLLLALKDSGGFESLVTGKTTDMQCIDVNERITGLERLNPTPRPTMSSFLEGGWNFEWLGAGTPRILASRILFERFPSTLGNLLGLDLVIKDGYAKTTANMKLLSSIASRFVLTSKLSAEGPLRMKEEYVEGVLETPIVSEEAVPEQLKGGNFQRLFMVSYLDDEILIIRDSAGVPDVLTRLNDPPAPMADPITEYES